MNRKSVVALFMGCAGAALLFAGPTIAQELSGTSLSVTGTATIGSLSVTGTDSVTDLQGHELLFGLSTLRSTSTTSVPGVVLSFVDSGTSQLKLTASQPTHQWLWERVGANLTSTVPMMKLDSRHVLTVYGTSGNPAFILDPSSGATFSGVFNVTGANSQLNFNGSQVLTQAAADQLYVSGSILSLCSPAVSSYGFGPSVVFSGGTATSYGCFVGPNASAGGDGYGFGGIAIGIEAIAGSAGSIALGWSANADGGSIALGSEARAAGDSSTALGSGANAAGGRSTALGFAASATGDDSVAIGSGAMASGVGSTAMVGGTATGDSSFAISGSASGYGSLAFGARTIATGDYSTAIGDSASATGLSSTAIGPDTVANGYGQIVLGRCNVVEEGLDPSTLQADQALFVIGNGDWQTSSAGRVPQRSNALVVKKNGDTTIYGGLTLAGTNSTILSGTGNVVVTGTISATALSGTFVGNIPASSITSGTLGDSVVVPLVNLSGSLSASQISGTLPVSQISGLSEIAKSGSYSALIGAPTDLSAFDNSAGYIKSSGTAAYALASATASALSGTIQPIQVNGLADVAITGSFASLRGLPTTLAGYQISDPVLLSTGTYSDPAWLTGLSYSKLTGTPTIPTTLSALTNDAGYIKSSGTAAYAIASATAAALSGTIQPTQVNGLAAVATTGDFASLQGRPTTLAGYQISDPVLLSSGTYADPAWLTALSYSKLTGAPTIPTTLSSLTNDAGYIKSSGTASYALASDSAISLSGTIAPTQVSGLVPVATGGQLEFAKLNNVPNFITSGGNASNLALSGTTTVAGGILVTGTEVGGTVVASGTNNLVLIPQQGDLSMGDFNDGPKPLAQPQQPQP